MSRASQFYGFVLADENLANQEWAEYTIFSSRTKAFLKLPLADQYRIRSMQFEDLSALMAPHKDKPCAEFFELPKRDTLNLWISRTMAWQFATYMSNPDMQTAAIERSIQISHHKNADMRIVSEQSLDLSESWDKMCLESDMTVHEAAFTMSNSPEWQESPEWKFDKKRIAELENRFR